jgi:hypothetical protein
MQPRPKLDFSGRAELEWSAFWGFTANSFEGSVNDVSLKRHQENTS